MPTTSVLWCRPRPSPCVAPPTYVSSTSTGHSVPMRSRPGRTIAARSLCSISNAVLVALDAKLPLELEGAHTRRLRCHHVRSPKPDWQGLPRSVHDRARCKTNLVSALTTFQHAWSGLKTPRVTDPTTGWAFETFWPPDTFQMASAGHLIREEMLKLQQSSRVICHAPDHTSKCQPVLNGWAWFIHRGLPESVTSIRIAECKIIISQGIKKS